MFAETSDKLLINISSKTEIKTKSNKLQIEQAQKYIQLGILKWSIYKIKTKNLLWQLNLNTIFLHFILLNFIYEELF